MPYSISQIFLNLIILPEILAVIIGFVRLKKLTRSMQYLLALVSFGVATEIVAKIYWMNKKENLFLFPLFTCVQFAMIAWIYRTELTNPRMKKIIPVLILGFTVFTVLEKLLNKSHTFNALGLFIESGLILSFVLMYFAQILKSLSIVHLERTPMFWVSAGLFIYFAANTIIFIFSNYILSYSKQFNMEIWVIHGIFVMVLYLLYTLALWISPKS